MKKILCLAGLGSLFLFGCLTVSDVNGNDFIKAQAATPQPSMVGFWVGASGPYLNTLKINNDGTGEFCYSWNSKNVNGKLIFDGKKIIYQSGMKLEITGITDSTIDAAAYYYGKTKVTFYKDNDLAKSSTFCQNVFKK